MEVMSILSGWVIAILAAVVEAVVPSLVSVWFVPGSLAGLVVSLCGGPIWLQIFVFLAVSLALPGLYPALGEEAAGPSQGAHQRR